MYYVFVFYETFVPSPALFKGYFSHNGHDCEINSTGLLTNNK